MKIDTLDFFVSKHAYGLSKRPRSLQFTQYVDNGDSVIVKSPNQFEFHQWDKAWLYLVTDTSVGGVMINGEFAKSYHLKGGLWLRRQMELGETLEVHPIVTWQDRNCRTLGVWTSWYYLNTLEWLGWLDIKGDIGRTEVICLKFNYLSAFERFYYSNRWGLVRWEYYDNANAVVPTSQVTLNQKSKPIKYKPRCGVPNLMST